MNPKTDGRVEVVEEVKFHTRIKHKFIDTYLSIWTNNVAKNHMTSKKRIPSLEIYDLYAASGWCYCDELTQYGLEGERWEGSALLAARCIGEYPKGTRLFLNSYHPDPDIRQQQRATLEESLKPYYAKYPRLRRNTTITSLPVEKAVVQAERMVNRNFPSIFILDPYEPKQLPWHVIERIGRMQGQYQLGGAPRKPEMIINLMTSYLQRFSDTQPEFATIALGMKEDLWRSRFEAYKETSNARDAFIQLYRDRLGEFYIKPPVVALVRDTSNRAVVYAMLLCTDSDAGHFMMAVKGIQELKRWKVEVWEPQARKMTVLKKDQGQTFLNV
ncbi:three-Cys-motif partner protein TcmP [Methanoculleus sp.]|uniref:three-Cys-motif partner protein TcmP n=1 Tax=Methanoculleus sp. TaxID=90427 RepID=UPI00262E94E6|nr:three-Cys-motif partner protein TcmP [Methanoculleus sp.]MDI6720659.1 three-Cys-motif partner protein TcmP [Methanomicrobiales archaeon]MDI6867710.1 three-Cys-motif partner protein TcmP [Methanoculleus sp.]